MGTVGTDIAMYVSNLFQTFYEASIGCKEYTGHSQWPPAQSTLFSKYLLLLLLIIEQTELNNLKHNF